MAALYSLERTNGGWDQDRECRVWTRDARNLKLLGHERGLPRRFKKLVRKVAGIFCEISELQSGLDIFSSERMRDSEAYSYLLLTVYVPKVGCNENLNKPSHSLFQKNITEKSIRVHLPHSTCDTPRPGGIISPSTRPRFVGINE
ncbi:hypothetical protein TNCV_3051281 [Trichonephila clavipes]|nr:hypothetical protein TNCV_3051281 [Trichonephila clavipes]